MNIQCKKTKPVLMNKHGFGGGTLQRSTHLMWKILVYELVRNMFGNGDFR